MRRRRVAGAAALAGAALLSNAGRVAAQTSDAPPGVRASVTVHAGGTAFTRFQHVTLEATGSPQGTYPASLSSATAASLGADLTLWFSDWVGTRLHLGYAPSSFEVRLTEEDRVEVLGDESDYQRLDYSDMSIFTAGGAAVLALPIRSSRGVAPYVLLGGGGTLYAADERGARGLDAAFDGESIAIAFAAVAGLGVKIPLASARISLSFEITDHVTPTPVPGDDDRILLETGDLRVTNRLHAMADDTETAYVHAVAVAAGLTFALGREPAQ